MKMLVQRTRTTGNVAFDLTDLKEYLRVTHDDEDASLLRMGLAAVEEVEHFAQVAVLSQTIRVTALDLLHGSGIALPIGPMAEGAVVSVIIDGEPLTGADLTIGSRPWLTWPASIRGKLSRRVVIEYAAGFGDKPEDVPEDLAQAIRDQAGLIFVARAEADAKIPSRSSHLARVGARYRGVSI